MLDTLLLRASLHLTPLHYTCRHFTSSHFNFTQLHFSTLSFGLTPFKFPTAPFRLTSLYFAALLDDFFSSHFYSFHFTAFKIAFPTPFLKILCLQGKVPNVSSGSWFQFLMVLFTKEYFPISVICNTVWIKGSSVNQRSLLSDMSCQNAVIHLSTFILQHLLYLIKNVWGEKKHIFTISIILNQ